MILDKDLLTVKEVARELRVDETTIRRWIKNGVLPAISLPKQTRNIYRIKVDTVLSLLEVNI